MERSFEVHAINPKQMDRFRDRFTVAGAKDDSRCSEVMASALLADPHCLRRLTPTDPIVVELREWSRIADDLTAERIRLTNRVRDQLWRYFPAILKLDTDLEAEWLLDLLQLVPRPTRLRGCARRPSASCSSAIASVASTPHTCSRYCVPSRCVWPPAPPWPPALTSQP